MGAVGAAGGWGGGYGPDVGDLAADASVYAADHREVLGVLCFGGEDRRTERSSGYWGLSLGQVAHEERAGSDIHRLELGQRADERGDIDAADNYVATGVRLGEARARSSVLRTWSSGVVRKIWAIAPGVPTHQKQSVPLICPRRRRWSRTGVGPAVASRQRQHLRRDVRRRALRRAGTPSGRD